MIDPELEWGSFLGGGVDDAASDVTTDAAGFVYVAGRTGSRNLATLGALDGWDERNAICEDRPCGDAFVAKLPARRRRGWCTSPTSPGGARTAPRRSRPTRRATPT